MTTGDALVDRGLVRVGLDKAELMGLAQRRTGLTDWGEWSLHEGLDTWLHAAQHEAELNFIGRYTARNVILNVLRNRLLFIEECKGHPERLEERVRRPVIIAAPPRTGSTLLQRLLASHPDAMSLPLWQAIHPLPSLDTKDLRGREARGRVRRAQDTAWATDMLMPGMKRLHESGARLPVECSYLMGGCMTSLQLWTTWPVHSFADWLQEQDAAESYRYLLQHLQLLQADMSGGSWVLKAPAHFIAVEQVLDTFDDALVVQIHRDPARFIPSLHNMLSMAHHLTSVDPQFERTAEALDRAVQLGSMRSIEARGRHDPGRFYDVHYKQLAAAPLQTARGVCERAGMRWDAEVEAALQGYLDAHPKGRHGPHVYSPSQTGRTAARIRERFSDYIDYFGIIEE